MKVGPISVGGAEGGGRRISISRPGGGKEAKLKGPEIPKVGGVENGGENKGMTSSQAEVASAMVADIGKKPGGPDALLHAAADGEFPPPDPEAVAAHAEQLRPLANALGPDAVVQTVDQLQEVVAQQAPVAEPQAPAGPDQAAQAEALAEAEQAAAEQRTRAYMEVTREISADIDPNANPTDIINQINANKSGDARWNPTEDTINYIKGAQQFKRDQLAAEAPRVAEPQQDTSADEPVVEPIASAAPDNDPAHVAGNTTNPDTGPQAAAANPDFDTPAAVNPDTNITASTVTTSPSGPDTQTDTDSADGDPKKKGIRRFIKIPFKSDKKELTPDELKKMSDGSESGVTPTEEQLKANEQARIEFLANEKNKEHFPQEYELLKKASEGDVDAQKLVDNLRIGRADFLGQVQFLSNLAEKKWADKKNLKDKEKEHYNPKNPNYYKGIIHEAYKRSTTQEDVLMMAANMDGKTKPALIEMMGQEYFDHFEKLLDPSLSNKDRTDIASALKGVVGKIHRTQDLEAVTKANAANKEIAKLSNLEEPEKEEEDKFLLWLKILGAAAIMTGVDMGDLSTGGMMKKTMGMS